MITVDKGTPKKRNTEKGNTEKSTRKKLKKFIKKTP